METWEDVTYAEKWKLNRKAGTISITEGFRLKNKLHASKSLPIVVTLNEKTVIHTANKKIWRRRPPIEIYSGISSPDIATDVFKQSTIIYGCEAKSQTPLSGIVFQSAPLPAK